MLTDELFDVWCLQQALSEQAKTIIQRIRSSPPSRLVRGAAGNVSGRYPSKKMGCTIQFESHRGELAFIYQLEHDPAVLEFYDQPEPIKLTYQGKTGRQVGLFHTPDFFVLREDGGGWVECKMEEQLPQLASHMPQRYIRAPDGTWSCPPGEAYAKPFGLSTGCFPAPRLIGSTNATSGSWRTISAFPVRLLRTKWLPPFTRCAKADQRSPCWTCLKDSRWERLTMSMHSLEARGCMWIFRKHLWLIRFMSTFLLIESKPLPTRR